jgi:hypothetical protein
MIIPFITITEEPTRTNGGLCMETTRKSMIILILQIIIKIIKKIFAKDKATQGLPLNSNELFFELIDAFMNSKLCFQSPTFKGFHEYGMCIVKIILQLVKNVYLITIFHHVKT